MQISIIQAILIGTLYYLTNNGVPWLTGQIGRAHV